MRQQSSIRRRIVGGGAAVIITGLVVFGGCAGPVQQQGEELEEREKLQRQRTIQPLEDVDEERRGEMAPTIFEFYVDEQGRLRVDLLPYVIVDPGEDPPEDTPEELPEDIPEG